MLRSDGQQRPHGLARSLLITSAMNYTIATLLGVLGLFVLTLLLGGSGADMDFSLRRERTVPSLEDPAAARARSADPSSLRCEKP